MRSKDIFVKKDDLTKDLHGVIKDEIKRRNFAKNNEIYTPVQITECPRRIIYRARGTKVDQNYSYVEETAREYIKNKWIAFFDSLNGIKIADRDIVAADCNYNLTGKIDAILKINDCLFVLLIKSLSEKDYSKVNEDGAIKRHVIEIMLLMWLSEVKHGILLYENKNTQDYNIFHVLPYKAIITSAKNKCLKLLGNQMKGTIPPRFYDDDSARECTICEYKSVCWEIKVS